MQKTIEKEIGYVQLLSSLNYMLKFYYIGNIYLDIGVQPEVENIRKTIKMVQIMKAGAKSDIKVYENIYANKCLLYSIVRLGKKLRVEDIKHYKILLNYYKMNMDAMFKYLSVWSVCLN